MSLRFYLILACAGGVGSVCRFTLGRFAIRMFELPAPWPTLVINCLGALLIGAFAEFFSGRDGFSSERSSDVQLWMISGLLGGFTTFSAFSLETVQLMQAGLWSQAVANVFLSVLLCLLMCMVGMYLARMV